jgi:hypothetical protein
LQIGKRGNDGIGHRGFTDDVMPAFDRALARDHGGSLLMAIFDDFDESLHSGSVSAV